MKIDPRLEKIGITSEVISNLLIGTENECIQFCEAILESRSDRAVTLKLYTLHPRGYRVYRYFGAKWENILTVRRNLGIEKILNG
ncbi:hypothetical protein EBU71_08890 [bacterium]|nr:hypothetical protein [Candidatus Elulimicrobium humile]